MGLLEDMRELLNEKSPGEIEHALKKVEAALHDLEAAANTYAKSLPSDSVEIDPYDGGGFRERNKARDVANKYAYKISSKGRELMTALRRDMPV